MAELKTVCCTPQAQETCCEPSEKASCCGESHDGGCGCSAGSVQSSTPAVTATAEQVRETVRQKYAAAATTTAASGAACCDPASDTGTFGAALYADSGERDALEAAINASLGCGVPTAVADLHDGETVLDLGSGAAPTS